MYYDLKCVRDDVALTITFSLEIDLLAFVHPDFARMLIFILIAIFVF